LIVDDLLNMLLRESFFFLRIRIDTAAFGSFIVAQHNELVLAASFGLVYALGTMLVVELLARGIS